MAAPIACAPCFHLSLYACARLGGVIMRNCGLMMMMTSSLGLGSVCVTSCRGGRQETVSTIGPAKDDQEAF